VDSSGVGSTVAAHRDPELDIHKLPGNCRFEPSPCVVREGPWKDTGMPSPYRWVIVGLGGLMGCVAIGAMFSLAVLLGPISAATGWSRAAISSAMTLDFLVMGFAGFAWGAASDRLGTRVVVLTGAIILGAGLWLASRATSPLMFQLGFGVFVGVACGAFIAPMIAAVTAWFDTQRALAVSLVSAGMVWHP